MVERCQAASVRVVVLPDPAVARSIKWLLSSRTAVMNVTCWTVKRSGMGRGPGVLKALA